MKITITSTTTPMQVTTSGTAPTEALPLVIPVIVVATAAIVVAAFLRSRRKTGI